MIIRFISAALLAGAIMNASLAAAAEENVEFVADPYEATGAWRISHNSYACTIRRDFENDERRISFVMRRVHPGGGIQYGIFGDGVERRKDDVTAGFIPSRGPAIYTDLASAAIGDIRGYVFAGPAYYETAVAAAEGGDREEIAERYRLLAGNTKHFAVAGLTEKPIALATGAMTKAFENLDSCVADRLAEMGITEEIMQATVSSPEPVAIDEWSEAISRIYPREALRERFEGTVEMRVVVGADGNPRHCHVADQMIARPLRDAACEAMIEHSRFEPARSSDGDPLPGIYFQRVRYVIPLPPNADGSRPREIR